MRGAEDAQVRRKAAATVTRRILVIVFLSFAVLVGLLPVITRTLFFEMPGRSALFDCDDSALLMYGRLQGLGIEATPIIGNLKVTGETPQEIDHVWLLVKVGGVEIAFDWGLPYFDRQHYEGFPVTLDRLTQYVINDFEQAAVGIPAR